MTVNTVSEMASWMILSCIRVKGPPLMRLPMTFAGTAMQYSKKAIPQEATITRNSGQSVLMCISLSLRFPYQANVMNTLEQQRRRMVNMPAFMM